MPYTADLLQIWLLKKRMVVELHTYVYLCVPAPAGTKTVAMPNTGELQVGGEQPYPREINKACCLEGMIDVYHRKRVQG